MARTRRRTFRSAAYIVVGVLILLSPVVLTQLKNVEQARLAEAYSQSVAQMGDQRRAQLLADARAYNERLTTVGRDPWAAQPDTESPAYQEYLSLLDVDHVMARVRVPSVGIDLPVYHGTSQRTLAAGVGHLYGTALPVGGLGTHSVLTGHTGLATVTMFDNLTHIKVDDVVLVDVAGETLAYQVERIETVLPDEVDHIAADPDRDLLTLITCTPYGINSHRLLVHAERLEQVPSPLVQTYRSPWQPWMVAVIAVSALALLYLVVWLVRRRRDDDPQLDNPMEGDNPVEGGRR